MKTQQSQIFTSEDHARKQAQYDILAILNDKSMINIEKFEKTSDSQKRKIQTLESQLAFMISNQIDSIEQVRNFSEECNMGLQQCEQEIETLNDNYKKEEQFYEDCDLYEQLSVFKKNVAVLLDQLKYFFNVKAQIDKIQQLFEQGIDNYEHISYKLLALTDIRDNVIDTIKYDNKATSNELQIIIQQFQSLSEFEEKFYATIYKEFEMTLLLCIKNPAHIISLLRIMETGDRLLATRGKPPSFKNRTIEAIQRGIDKKFDEKLKGQKEAVMVLEHAKFTASDLILTLDHVVKCFPKNYNIFNVFEDQYKMNIEKRIMPFLDNEDEVKKSYGTLIALLNWMQSYEDLLSRLGLQNDSYIFLKTKVKYYMPYFIEHIQNLIVEYSQKAILKDKEEQQTLQNIEKLIKTRQELVTFFPEDIFHFINQQIDILGPKLQGELYVEFLRSMCQTLSDVLKAEATNLLQSLPLQDEPGSSVSPIFIAVLYVNNFYRCVTYANETKQYCGNYAEESTSERIESVFSGDLIKELSGCVTKCLEQMIKMVFLEVNTQVIPSLFQPKWVNEELMSQIVNTLKDYLQDIQTLMINQIYFNKFTKLVFTNLVDIYIEQLITTVKYVQPNILKNFFPKLLTDLSLLQDDGKKKKEKERKAGITSILQNRELVIPQMQQDIKIIMKSINEEYGQQVGQSTQTIIEKKINCIISLLQKSKLEIEGLILQVSQNYDQIAPFVLEATLWMREDCDAQFKQLRLDQLINVLNSKNPSRIQQS